MSDSTNPNNEQVVSNPATQTLFRFVSLRNPQLAETSEKNLGFIIRPDYIQGDFDTAIQSWTGNPTKIQILEQEAADFEILAFTKEKDIENLSSIFNYYKLGKSLAQGKTVVENLTIPTDRIENDSLESLWNNLIYQVVTQKDFYIKEAIIQTLKAIHYADVYGKAEANKLEENTTQAKNAKVVLPAKLFVEDAPVENEVQNFTVDKTVIGSDDTIVGGGTAARILEPSQTRSLSVMQESRLKVNAEKNLQVTNALLKKEMLQTLKKELEKLQKSYSKAYYKAYNSELAAYQAEVQPIIESNNALLDDLEATFDENTTEAEKKAAYDQLELAEVPKFEFTYKNEINFTDLYAKLTPESFNMFLELFTEYDAETISNGVTNRIPQDLHIISDTALSLYNTDVTLSEDYSSYSEIFSKLGEDISEQSKSALSAVEMRKQQYVNLGGALVPVANNVAKTPQAYHLQASTEKSDFSKLNNLYFSFEVENNSWSVAYAKVSAETEDGTKEQTFNNLSVVNDKIMFPATFVNQFEDLTFLKIELYFDNGREAILEFPDIVNNTSYTGIFNLKSSSENTSANGMAPKHFGVKRLGIADYLKVEQSIHAYVPGEVSNIENVMASELRHKSSLARDYSEITDTTSKSQETEKMSDTSKTSRTDMQTEVAKEIDKQQSIEAHTSFSAGGAKWKLEVGGSYANSTAQHDSTRQAVAKSQEITERAMERVLTKVSEERIQKIIKEFTETNVHEFDNRGQAVSASNANPARPQHITGVYRWVDKKMKNQIYNYGKRTMFEFMIPEPARLHRLAIGSAKNILTAPLDPRAEGLWQIKDYNVDQSFLQHWAEIYGVKLTDLPEKTKVQNIGRQDLKLEGSGDTRFVGIDILDNYTAKSARIIFGHNREKHGITGNKSQTLYYSNFNGGMNSHSSNSTYFTTGDTGFFSINKSGHYDYAYKGDNVNGCFFAFSFNCELSDSFINSWKQINFDAIIAAYDAALKAFNEVQAAADAQAVKDEAENKEKISLYYRDMESEVLKHNCIAYLLQNNDLKLGKALTEGNTMQAFKVKFDDLDAYTSLAKFMEQAMEWSIMDYTFYPYYWADSNNWQEMYLSSDLDPLFRNFLQAGMARVIVTVKPGFEDAVNFYMTTGRIWNGGEVPVIGDPMYLSIVEELREPAGKPQGNYWITRVPTALTILQAGSVGLIVDDALPIFPEDHPEECENPLELETVSSFGKPVDIVMQNTPGIGSTIPTEITNVYNEKISV